MTGGQKRKAAILLSIIFPIGLLATFRFTGILPGLIIPETYTVETIEWNMSRSNKVTSLDKTLTNLYNDGILSATFKVGVGAYYEGDVWGLGFFEPDRVIIRFDVAANITAGFIHSFVIRFSQVDANASLDVYEDDDHIVLHSVMLGAIHQAWVSDSGYIEAYAVNNRNSCNLTMFSYWIFYDDNNIDHNIIFSLETIYYNGAAYRKAVMPTQITVQIP
jgi:hypothetical protein